MTTQAQATQNQIQVQAQIQSQSPIQAQTQAQAQSQVEPQSLPQIQTPVQIQSRILSRIQTPQTETRPQPPQSQTESETSQEEKYVELINRRVGEGKSKVAIFYELRLLAKASNELKMLNDASVMKRFNKLINKGEMNAFLAKKKEQEEKERLKKGIFFKIRFNISYQNSYELLMKKKRVGIYRYKIRKFSHIFSPLFGIAY